MRKSKTGIILAAAMLAFTTAFSACTNSSSESYETESNPVIADSEGGTGNAELIAETIGESINTGEYEGKRDEAVQTLLEYYLQYAGEVTADPERQADILSEETVVRTEGGEQTVEVYTIETEERVIQYTMEIIGEPAENGLYPLYITLHGGGGADEETNNGQWMAMTEYYRYSVESGIYLAVRGMEDVWNMHFLDDAYPVYDRLIEDMIIFCNADPDRVYLLGFSAGGDGVYAIAPRMADRFAAVNMSSGHPNGVSLLNTSNLPFEIQVGIRDYYSEEVSRCVRGAEFEKELNSCQEFFGCEYPHRVLVHVPEGHNYNDSYDVEELFGDSLDASEYDSYVLVNPEEYAERAVEEDWYSLFNQILAEFTEDVNDYELSYQDPDGFDEAIFEYVTDELGMDVTKDEDTNAVHYVNQYTRNPIPNEFVWDLSTRANKRKDTAFYWLKADFDVNEGVVRASYDEESNSVTVDVFDDVNGDITVLVNPRLVDLNRPLTIITPNGEQTVEIEVDEDVAAASVRETGDFYLSWVYEIPVELN